MLKFLKSILIEISKVVNFRQTRKHLKNIKLKQCLGITSVKILIDFLNKIYYTI